MSCATGDPHQFDHLQHLVPHWSIGSVIMALHDRQLHAHHEDDDIVSLNSYNAASMMAYSNSMHADSLQEHEAMERVPPLSLNHRKLAQACLLGINRP